MSVLVSEEAFQAADELCAFEAANEDVGAIASFSGLVRAEAGAGTALILESYGGFTERWIEGLEGQAVERYNLLAVRIRHRVGAMGPGDTIVFVAASAPHRREALDAVDFLMDHLKSAAPFWKKEIGAAGERWIEPTAADVAARKRWEV